MNNSLRRADGLNMSLSEMFVIEVNRTLTYEKQGKKHVITFLQIIPKWKGFTQKDIDEISSKRFRGEAVCSPEDEFDLIKGKDLSNHRAMVSAYGYIKTFLRNYAHVFYSDMGRVLSTIETKQDKQRLLISKLKD